MHWQAAFWAIAVAILWLAFAPASESTPGTGWDKTNHLIAFALLTICGLRAYPLHAAAMLGSVFLYGGLIELLQSATLYRAGEWSDLLADGIGVLLGWGWSAYRRSQTARTDELLRF
jgi:VanZ family protein